MGMYKYLAQSFRDANLKERIIEWRRGNSHVRIEKPTKLNAARKFGYKAKPGFVIVRSKLKRGGIKKSRPKAGRKPSRMGTLKFSAGQSHNSISEQRLARKFPNLEVLGTYFLAQDGQYRYMESVLVDPYHPAIKNDKDANWICERQHKNRAFRGLTPAGKKGRGLRKTGKGAEKV